MNCDFYSIGTVRSAVHSLLLHKLRSGLSILGIVCGVMMVFSILAIGEGAKRETLRQLEQMGGRNVYIRADNLNEEQLRRARRQHSQGIQLTDIQRIEALDINIRRIAAVRNRLVDPLGFPENITPRFIATTDNYLAVLGLSMSTGRFINAIDIAEKNKVCVLGWSVAEALGKKGRSLDTLRIGADLWKVVGILEKRDILLSDNSRISLQDINDVVLLPIGTMPMNREEKANALSELIVEFASAEQVITNSAIVRRRLQTVHQGVDDFSCIIPMELLAQSKNMQRLFAIVFGAMGGLSLLIGGIGIMNIMLAGVSERVREIGLRRAVGARPLHIVVQFLVEAVLLTAAGGVLGICVGFALSEYISYLAGWPVFYDAIIICISLLLAVTTGLFFGMYPALQASKMDPLNALGYLA